MELPSTHRTAHPGPVPATAGIGLRAAHQAEIIRDRPPVGRLEVDSEKTISQIPCVARFIAPIA